MRANRPKNRAFGYGNPPIHTRFKKGQSGNPKGRPKGSKNLATLLERVLTEQVVITENGKRRSISKLEASFKQLLNGAAIGDLAAMRQLYALLPWLESQLDSEPSPAATNTSDQAALERVRKRLLHIAERIRHEKETGTD
jgi:hypothetical protein